MLSKLYPLKFEPIVVTKLWGGSKLHTKLHKPNVPNAGESWELSGVKGNESIVSNGALKGEAIKELLATYKTDLVGNPVYQAFGNEFPLLIKFIDASDELSVQVHPDDSLAQKKHDSFGKTEMWYVIDADEGAQLNCGFNKTVDRAKVRAHIAEDKLLDILNFVPVQEGDVFFIPAGTVHAIGRGMLIAEIQQSSDITYRLFDFNRRDTEGNLRELHTEDSLGAIDYTNACADKAVPKLDAEGNMELIKCEYFKTNLVELGADDIKKDISQLDSFVVYMCVEGEVSIIYSGGSYPVRKGETLLIPACCKEFVVASKGVKSKLLEVYMPME